MTKNEALKAAIDGKKVRPVLWAFKEDYWFWNGAQFMFVSSGKPPVETTGTAFRCEWDWQILPEYVDFAEAWKAYEGGKQIQSLLTKAVHAKRINNGPMSWFTPAEIRGKWLILEDK